VTLVTRSLTSGLVLAERASDEAGIQRALKEIDDRYVLQANTSELLGELVYEVLCVWSEEHPPLKIMAWTDERGRPLPLSSGLVEEVKKWRPEARNRRGPDADERNERLREQTDRLRRDQLAAISGDHRGKVERDQVSVSIGTLPKQGYLRNRRPPQSGIPR